MTFTPPRIPPVFETNKVPNPNDANNPGTPIGCVYQEQDADGSSPNTPPFGSDNTSTVIRLDAMIGNDTPTVGQADGYQVALSNNNTAANPVWTWEVVNNTDPAVQITTGGGIPQGGAIVTWGTVGTHTIRATVSDVDASNNPQSQEIQVTVGAAPAPGTDVTVTVTSTDFVNEAAIPNAHSYAGALSNGCTGSNTSPQISIVLSTLDNVDTVQFRVTDIDGNGFRHWEFDFAPTATTTAIAQDADVATTLTATVAPNGWQQAGANDTNANGWGGPCPPQGDGAHRYNFVAIALDANGDELGRGVIQGTFTNGAAPTNVEAVAENTSLNFVNGATTPSAQTLTDIQTAFTAAENRLNGLVAVGGNRLTAITAANPGWVGMTVPEVRLFSDITDDTLASMTQSTANFTQGIATTCQFLEVNIAQMTTNGGAFDVTDLGNIICHELLHGLGVGAGWLLMQGALTAQGILIAEQNSTAFFMQTSEQYDALAAAQGLPRPGDWTSTPVGTPTTGIGNTAQAGFNQGHWMDQRRTLNGDQIAGISNDMMVQFYNANNMITELSLACLADLGYIADPDDAEASATLLNISSYALPVAKNFRLNIV